MSSILKALKKVEQERASQRDGTVNITLDVIKGGDRPARGLTSGIIPLVALGVCLAVLAVGVLKWRAVTHPDAVIQSKGQDLPIEVALPAERPKTDPIPETVSVVKSAPAVSSKPVPATVPVTGTPHVKSAPEAIPPTVTPQLTSSGSSVASVGSVETEQSSVSLPASESVNIVSQATQSSDHRINRFVLTDIVYDRVATNRLAVINDLPVMEGTMVDDATVVEILSDRVRLDVSGETLEILRP